MTYYCEKTNKKQPSKIFILLALVLITISTTACGQRAPVKAPDDKVEDSKEY